MFKHFCDYDKIQLKKCVEYVYLNNPYIEESYTQNNLEAYILERAKQRVSKNAHNFTYGRHDDIVTFIGSFGFYILITCDILEDDNTVYWWLDFLVDPSIADETEYTSTEVLVQ